MYKITGLLVGLAGVVLAAAAAGKLPLLPNWQGNETVVGMIAVVFITAGGYLWFKKY